ncbi:MAG: dihydropteroate synthase, partial [Dehalococcoidales bacterium]|nr:dihydropteroate synthase [Dehalococcoidales bacterium]
MKKQLIPVNFGGFDFIWGLKTYVMGIVNASVESFSGDGTSDIDKLLTRVGQCISEGADIIDVGGLSTRPGFKEISEEDEIGRIIPLIKETRCAFDIPISCDTYRVRPAMEALKNGANIINDVSGLAGGKEMASLVASYDAGVVLTSNQRGQTIEGDICDAVINDLNRQIEICRSCGVKDHQIILDPGIGFGKTVEQN